MQLALARVRVTPLQSPIMKRPRRTAPLSTTKSPSPPSTPPTPQLLLKRTTSTSVSTSHSSIKPKAILKTLKTHAKSDLLEWVPLGFDKSELSLALTFPTGQTFTWKKTGPLQYTGVVGSHLISLKHLQNGHGSYCIHHTTSGSGADARMALLDFLNASVSLADIWKIFSDSDARFAELACHLGGARVLRQDPLECLIQFLCSSNNNIKRITKMVDYISSLGDYLGSVEGYDFHAFPSLDRLSFIKEQELREAGFGYR